MVITLYSNFFLVDDAFLNMFGENERKVLANFAYSMYRKCGNPRSKRLSLEEYFCSTQRRYSVVYTFCPKCKKDGFLLSLGNKQAQGLKYCPNCGEPNISYRFRTGRQKICAMLQISEILGKSNIELSKYQNQQIVVMLCSVLEVYLREFYADILNSKFIVPNSTLYEKFIRDCKNDFLNPGKTHDRLKKELGIDYKNIVGQNAFKWLNTIADIRNVVVHNNGICDSTFIRKYPDVEQHSEICPKFESVVKYLQVIDFVTSRLDETYQKIILESVSEQLSTQVRSSNLGIYLHPRKIDHSMSDN